MTPEFVQDRDLGDEDDLEAAFETARSARCLGHSEMLALVEDVLRRCDEQAGQGEREKR